MLCVLLLFLEMVTQNSSGTSDRLLILFLVYAYLVKYWKLPVDANPVLWLLLGNQTFLSVLRFSNINSFNTHQHQIYSARLNVHFHSVELIMPVSVYILKKKKKCLKVKHNFYVLCLLVRRVTVWKEILKGWLCLYQCMSWNIYLNA